MSKESLLFGLEAQVNVAAKMAPGQVAVAGFVAFDTSLCSPRSPDLTQRHFALALSSKQPPRYLLASALAALQPRIWNLGSRGDKQARGIKFADKLSKPRPDAT